MKRRKQQGHFLGAVKASSFNQKQTQWLSYGIQSIFVKNEFFLITNVTLHRIAIFTLAFFRDVWLCRLENEQHKFYLSNTIMIIGLLKHTTARMSLSGNPVNIINVCFCKPRICWKCVFFMLQLLVVSFISGLSFILSQQPKIIKCLSGLYNLYKEWHPLYMLEKMCHIVIKLQK